jgi:hypothetical protein
MTDSPVIYKLNELLKDAGMFVRGSFQPGPADGAPPLADGSIAATIILIGNAGGDMWQAFEPQADRTLRHSLDSWLRPEIDRVAAEIGATPVFPNDGPPFVPVQDWAARAEPVYRSPIGIMIHPEFGLWHVYRAAFLFGEAIDLAPRTNTPSPCDSCTNKPCLSVCPADAFLPDRFDAQACVSHVYSAAGTICRERGCLARRACPVGREYLYGKDQQAFHTAALVSAVKRGYGVK